MEWKGRSRGSRTRLTCHRDVKGASCPAPTAPSKTILQLRLPQQSCHKRTYHIWLYAQYGSISYPAISPVTRHAIFEPMTDMHVYTQCTPPLHPTQVHTHLQDMPH